MSYIVCSGCSTCIEIPAELLGDAEMFKGEISTGEPYYCDACEWEHERNEAEDEAKFKKWLLDFRA